MKQRRTTSVSLPKSIMPVLAHLSKGKHSALIVQLILAEATRRLTAMDSHSRNQVLSLVQDHNDETEAHKEYIKSVNKINRSKRKVKNDL